MTLITLKDTVIGWLSMKIRGVTFVIEPINACCLRCPSCPTGIFKPRNGQRMSIETFRAILDKAQSECKIRVLHLYYVGEEFLHPDLHLFVEECRKRNIKCCLSTVLQVINADVAKVIAAGPAEFRISFPGLNFIEKYQKGGNPRRFMENFRKIVVMPRHPDTRFTMFYQVYRDNQGQEMENAKALARMYHLDFVAVPSVFMATETVISKDYTEADKELISNLIKTPEEAIAGMDTSSRFCLAWKHIAMDAMGMVYVCTLLYKDEYKLAPFLDTPLKDLQRMIRTSPACGPCMEAGANVYQYCFSEMTEHSQPVEVANRKRMKK